MGKGKNIIIAILITIVIALVSFMVLAYKGVIKVDFLMKTEETKTEEKETKTIKLTEQEALGIGTILYDKATEAYEVWQLLPYCGMDHAEIRRADEKDYGNSTWGPNQYVDSGMKDLEELKDHLRTFLSENIIKEKITKEPVTDLTLLQTKEYSYNDYVIENNKLYCRSQGGGGNAFEATGNYYIEVKELNDSKIVYNITSEYYSTNASDDCRNDYYKYNCKDSDLTTEDTEFVIEKNDSNNWVVTKYVLHH